VDGPRDEFLAGTALAANQHGGVELRSTAGLALYLAGRRAGTDFASGLSCPDYEPLVRAFGFRYLSLKKQDKSDEVLREFLKSDGPIVLEVYMAPDQLLVPKLSVSITAEGKFVSPPIEDLSPLIPLEILKSSLLVPLHPNSIPLDRVVPEAKGDAIY
jgi:acetolactate synthase-1/2/3 large subunit